MDPTTSLFNLRLARRFLHFAIQFTPQYGDSFLEYMRLKLLTRGEDLNVIESRVLQVC